jgi:hypothetical protein
MRSERWHVTIEKKTDRLLGFEREVHVLNTREDADLFLTQLESKYPGFFATDVVKFVLHGPSASW